MTRKSSKVKTMDRQEIIMTYAEPPGDEDLKVIAEATFEILPEEIVEFCEDLVILVEDLADEALEDELDLNDPFDLLALYRSGKQVSPGVESTVANDDDVLIIFRRPMLDYWCESREDLSSLIREVMIEELGQTFDFSEDEIEEMIARHHQGLL